MCGVTDFAQWVHGPGVHIARLRAYDGRAGGLGKRGSQLVGSHSALTISRDRAHAGGSETQEAQREIYGEVPLFTGDDPDGRRADETVGLHVPADGFEHVMPGGG